MKILTEEQVRERIKKYFSIHELVGKRTFKTHGERAWKFLDYRLLYSLLIIREGIGKKITSNNWYWGGKFQQRGLRTIIQQMIKNYTYKDKLYLSAHLLGKADDFDVEGMSASAVRYWIQTNEHLFPFKIRLEDKVTWVHIDVIFEDKNPKVYLFTPPTKHPTNKIANQPTTK